MAKLLRAYKDFSGGLSEAANDSMRDNQLVEAQNIMPGDGYAISRASGYNVAYPRIGNGTQPVLAVLDAEFSETADGAQVLYVQTLAFTPEALWRYDEETGSWASVADGLQPMKDWFVAGKKLYWLDGAEYRVYDGETVQAVQQTGSGTDGAPSEAEAALWERVRTASFVEQRGQRWFFARSGYDDVIYTETGDPGKIGALNVLNFNSKNSDHITGLQEFNDGLLVFKERSVHYFSGWDFAQSSDIEIRQLNVTSGTKFHRSICPVNNAILYLGYNGIYRIYVPNVFSTIATQNVAEEKIANMLYEFDPTDAYATEWNGVYYFRITNAEESREYRYDISKQSFWGSFTQEHTCYSTNMRDVNLYLGCSGGLILAADADCFHYIATADDAENGIAAGDLIPIPIRAVTKGFDVSANVVQDVKLKRLQVVAKQYKEESSVANIHVKADYADLSWEIDFDESLVYQPDDADTESNEGRYGGTNLGWKETVTKEARVNKKAKRVQFIITDEKQDYPLLIYALALVYKLKKVKGSRDGVTGIPVAYLD